MSLPNLQSYNFQVQAGVTTPNYYRYVENANSQAAVECSTPIQVPASTNYQAVNLATLFPALTNGQVLIVDELTDTGFNISADNANQGFAVRPGSTFVVGINALPTFYISNPNATPIQLNVVVIGS